MQRGAVKPILRVRSPEACEQHHTVRYYRLGQLLDELNIGHADGSYRQQLAQLAKKKAAHPGRLGNGKTECTSG